MNIPFLNRKKMKSSEMIIIFQSLSFMFNAGLNKRASLRVLIEDEDSKINKAGPEALLDSIVDGESIASAFRENEDILGTGYWKQIEAAERTGRTAECFERLADQIKNSKSLAGKVRGALAYPIFVTIIALIAGYVMFTNAVPQMADMMEEMGGELPPLTKMMLGISELLVNYGIIVLALLILLIIAFIYLVTHQLKLNWDKFILKLPLIGPIIVNINYSNIYRIICDMIANGSPPIEALNVSAGSSKNLFINQELEESYILMAEEALDLAPALSKGATTMPTDDRLMIKVGQRTGRTIDILDELAKRRKQQAVESVDRLVEMLNPIIMAVVCVVVGIIVISVYMPMITMSQSIGV